MNNQKIGVLDSGVGGLTVVKELEGLMPHESIIYCGDNANCPYGNRTEDNIVELTKKMIDFLIEQDVKVIAIACNTISTLIDRYKDDYKIPIFGIIRPAATHVSGKGIKKVGVAATEFTIKVACYTKLIHEYDNTIEVIGSPSRNLAMLVDSGKLGTEEIETEVRNTMSVITAHKDIKDVILGCTHYPIVGDIFEKIAPDINYINPAYEQAMLVKKYVEENGLACDKSEGTFEVYTSGTEKPYIDIINILNINRKPNITIIKESAKV